MKTPAPKAPALTTALSADALMGKSQAYITRALAAKATGSMGVVPTLGIACAGTGRQGGTGKDPSVPRGRSPKQSFAICRCRNEYQPRHKNHHRHHLVRPAHPCFEAV